MQFFINGLEVTVTPIEKKNHMTHHVGVRQEGFSMGFFIPSILPEQMEYLITAELSQRLTQLAERVNHHLYHAMAEREYSIPDSAANEGEDEDEDEDGDIATGVRRRRWTKEENRLLLEAYFSNTSYEEIAQRHQRTSAAVRIRISKLLRGGK